MTSDAQRRANAKQDATRQRVALWLEGDDLKSFDRLMRKLKQPTRIATLRALMAKRPSSAQPE
jgi:hypothetical protein